MTQETAAQPRLGAGLGTDYFRIRHQLTPEQRDRAQQRAPLQLARTSIVRELEASRAPARRAALQRALADLDDRLAKL